ncbi:MAG TPA: SRPBCC family protein [Longimicrobiales bacterium]|nr:SRPBCC family protein [Longimicrobiales bacterium]
MAEPIRVERSVAVEPERAFRAFTEEMGSWWPRAYSWSRDVLEDMVIAPRTGGLCTELGPDGFRCDWGRVTAWEPPRRLAFTWQIAPDRTPAPDPARGSDVSVTFEAADGVQGAPGTPGTRVTLEHRNLERHGDEAGEYRAAMASEAGWPFILAAFADHIG